MAYFELIIDGEVKAASSSLTTIQQAYTTLANKKLRQHFGSYDEARSFIFEAGLQDKLFIRSPEYKDEDEPIVGTP